MSVLVFVRLSVKSSRGKKFRNFAFNSEIFCSQVSAFMKEQIQKFVPTKSFTFLSKVSQFELFKRK